MNQGLEYKTELDLAIEAIKNSQMPSIRITAALYDVPKSILHTQLQGRGIYRDAQINNRKLTAIEK